MIKVMIDCERYEQVDVFECDSINIWKDKRVACFTSKDNDGYIDREYYEFDSYNTVTGFILFKGGNLVSDHYKQ